MHATNATDAADERDSTAKMQTGCLFLRYVRVALAALIAYFR